MASTKLQEHDVFMRAHALISRAYHIPDAERDAFLESEAATDPELRAEVQSLLGALNGPEDDFLESNGIDWNEYEQAELKAPAPRNYILLRPLGEGGMGVVHLARRSDGDIQQLVALKFLNMFSLANSQSVSRFLRERKMLARLNHPNIARLIDAGALADGRPFLAMEYVDGMELDRYCDTHGLSIPERLRLFVKICAAVQYAHQNLIIHRDLKPANILITGEGEPKLLDFGIAREMNAPDATRTVLQQRIMTIAYASPEQLAGKPLTTASDQYSLGVILYELLSGCRPRSDDDDPLTLARRMTESNPLPPSIARRQATTAKLAGEHQSWKQWRQWMIWRRDTVLPADLDVIVLKVLRLTPEDRYGSVQELATDVERFLNNRPVAARQGHRWYRWRKYAHRNRFPLLFLLGAFLLVSGFAVNRQVQLDALRKEKEKVQQVGDFMQDLVSGAAPQNTGDKDMTALELVDRGAARLNQSMPSDPGTKLTLLNALTKTYSELGAADKASAENARALALSDSIGPSSGMAEALLNKSSIAMMRGHIDEEEQAATAALKMADGISGSKPELGAQALHHIAGARYLRNAPREQVIPLLQEGIARLKRADSKSALVVELECEIGFMLATNFNSAESLSYYEDAFRDNRQRHLLTDVALSKCQGGYGLALMFTGFFQESERTLRGVLRDQIAILGGDHVDINITKYHLGVVLINEGKYADAETVLREVVEFYRNLRPQSYELLVALAKLAEALAHLDRLDEAEQLYLEVMGMTSVVYPKSTLSVSRARFGVRFAYVLYMNKKIREAKALVAEVLRDLPSTSDETFISSKSQAYAISGMIAKNEGAIAEAEESFRKSIAIDEAHRGRSPAYYDLAVLLKDQGRYSEAAPFARDLFKYRQRAMPETVQDFIDAKTLLADIERHL
jgi:serine/threonine protein kinase/tetratricopeptide (TPR) repeat protein